MVADRRIAADTPDDASKNEKEALGRIQDELHKQTPTGHQSPLTNDIASQQVQQQTELGAAEKDRPRVPPTDDSTAGSGTSFDPRHRQSVPSDSQPRPLPDVSELDKFRQVGDNTQKPQTA